MEVLFRGVEIIDPLSKFDGKVLDVLVSEGEIKKIGSINGTFDHVVEGKEKVLMPGLVDVGVSIGEPGNEHREDLKSMSMLGLRGGFTELVMLPDTDPRVVNGAGVRHIKERSLRLPIDIKILGSITISEDSDDLSEIVDMYDAGVAGYFGGRRQLQDTGAMLRALEYIKSVKATLIREVGDVNLSTEGEMHEGKISVSLGLKGIPEIAELIQVERDIRLLEYSHSRLHIANVSSGKVVERIKKAKDENLDISSSVSVMNLIYTEEKLAGFDPNWKVYSPLRSEKDRMGLIEGLKDGAIDYIVSNHKPVEVELKDVEFGNAAFGAIGCQTAFVQSYTFLDDVELGDLVKYWSINPRKSLFLSQATIKVGNTASLTLFDPNGSTSFEKEDNLSKSSNCPYFGEKYRGKIIGVYAKNQLHLF